MTIKKRIVIWYTVWMAVLAAIMLSIVISGSEYLLRRGMMEDMLEEIQDAAEDIIVHNGQVYADPDGFFDDGIYISVIAPDSSSMRPAMGGL